MKFYCISTWCSFVLIAFVSPLLLLVNADRFPLTIVHINDFHARFEPTDTSGGTCDADEECIGGYARTVYTVKRILNEQRDKNPIYLNAGDSFQGTLWYNIGRWNVTSEFLNLLPAEAMTLGNHEFDHGVAGVVPFLETLNTTMLVANMDAINEPTIAGKYQKSTIIERGGRKIGLIGVIIETTYTLANTGQLIFYNESITIHEEALLLKKAGADIIIVISHCGYDVDKLIAKNAGENIDVIVGGHSHTFLYTGKNPPGPERPRGDYPTEVVHESGNRVLIVQASAYARYVGNLTVYFDDDGKVVDFEGAPLYMGKDVPQDDEVLEHIIPWKEVVDAEGNVLIGRTYVDLLKAPCSSEECNLGNFFCQAMIHGFVGLTPYDQSDWSNVAIGLINTGALRVPLFQGNLTYAHLVTMSPFENRLMAFNLPGDKLLEALEFSVRQFDLPNNVTSSSIFLQVSGLKVTYNISQPQNHRVTDLMVRCSKCNIPKYEKFSKKKIYRIVAPNFLVNGGDGFDMFPKYATDKQEAMTDLEALIAYTKREDPITIGLDNRIRVVT